MKYNLKPMGSYIVARMIKEKEKVTTGGIVMPQTAQDTPHMGRVEAVGPGMRNLVTGELIPVPINVGDLVILNNRAYRQLELPDGDKIALFNYGDVYGVLEEVDQDE